MEINNVYAEAVVSKNVKFNHGDAMALGIEWTNVLRWTLALDLREKYNKTPYDERKEFGDLPSEDDIKALQDKAVESLNKISKFINKIALYPSDSNIFND